ncbi:unnamed protein product, partial [Prunus brigantina]
LCPSFHHEFLTSSPTGRAKSVGCANLTPWCSGPRGCALTRDVLLLDAVRLCAGVPAQSAVRRDGDEWWCWWRVLGGAPARCSESDGRMIYGVNEMITGMVLRHLENQVSYDILMNGFSLQSTTTPRKA